MLKKILSAAVIFALLLTMMTVFPQAAENGLPFELVAPAYVTARWMEGGDSPTSTMLTYSLSNEMTTFFKNKENVVIKKQ